MKNNLKSQKDIEGFGELEYKELFDTWVQTFLSLYDSYPKKKEKPNVALVDFLENATLREFEEFCPSLSGRRREL